MISYPLLFTLPSRQHVLERRGTILASGRFFELDGRETTDRELWRAVRHRWVITCCWVRPLLVRMWEDDFLLYILTSQSRNGKTRAPLVNAYQALQAPFISLPPAPRRAR